MIITEVRVNVRRSIGQQNSWNTVELGATAILNGEGWEAAQADLYSALDAQVAGLLAAPAQQLPVPSAQIPTSDPEAVLWGLASQTPFCEKHGVPFKKYEKD